MSDDASAAGFDLGENFARVESGGLALGPLELQYEELFSEVLEDGVITAEERARLEKAADNLGVDRMRLARLEQAMVAAYEARHRVKIIEHYEEPAASLAPIDIKAAGDTGTALLQKRVAQLEERIRELESELRLAQSQINVEVDLSFVEDAAAEASEDPEDIWRRSRRNPTNPEPYRALFRIYSARGALDAQWCVSQVLVFLGAAKPDERAVYDKYRSEGLIAPKAAVSASSWLDHLFHPEEELLTGQIFAVIAPAVLLGRVTALRRDKKLHQPDPSLKQDPAKATITAVRAMAWAAAALGLAVPPIFLDKDRAAGFEHIPGVPPLTLVGAGALTGRTQSELAFMAGRHLSGYRQEHYVKTLFHAVPDLEDLFLAALTIGSPNLPIAEDMRRRVEPIARAIQPVLEPSHIDALRGHFLRFVEEGGRTNLQRWAASTEKTACRAGMLLANDLPSAGGVLAAEEGEVGELTRDLVSFVSSERYFKLRKQIGVAIG